MKLLCLKGNVTKNCFILLEKILNERAWNTCSFNFEIIKKNLLFFFRQPKCLNFLFLEAVLFPLKCFGSFLWSCSYLKIYFYSWMHSELTSPKGNILNPWNYVFIQKKIGLTGLPNPQNTFYCAGEMDTRWQREKWEEVVLHCHSSISQRKDFLFVFISDKIIMSCQPSVAKNTRD